jgi:hypothetical protein
MRRKTIGRRRMGAISGCSSAHFCPELFGEPFRPLSAPARNVRRPVRQSSAPSLAPGRLHRLRPAGRGSPHRSHRSARTATRLLAHDVLVLMLYPQVHALGWHLYAVRALHGAVEGTARVALFALVYRAGRPRDGNLQPVRNGTGGDSAILRRIADREIRVRRIFRRGYRGDRGVCISRLDDLG